MEESYLVFKIKEGYYIESVYKKDVANVYMKITSDVNDADNFSLLQKYNKNNNHFEEVVQALKEQTGGELVTFVKTITIKEN